MKQISLLFLETSVFFFSSVNIFTRNDNNQQPYTRKRIENSNNTTVNNGFHSNIKMKKGYNNNYIPSRNVIPSNDNIQITHNIGTGETPNRYMNQSTNQGYSYNNSGMIMPEGGYSNIRQYNPNIQQYNQNRRGYASELEGETINEIQLHTPESKGETPETEEENISIKYNVDDPKNQIPAIRSSAYVTRYNNGGNNRRGCCRIKNLKIEKNTVDMAKAKNNINNEIEKTIIEKFRNTTFNIVLNDDEIEEIRNRVFGDTYKKNSNSDKEVKEVEGVKRKKKKNKKKLKEEKEKEIKRKIIAAKYSIANSCIARINKNVEEKKDIEDEEKKNIEDEEKKDVEDEEKKNVKDFAKTLLMRFIESLSKEIEISQGENNIIEKEYNEDDKVKKVKKVEKIFEEHFDKEIENIITNDNFIRKKCEEYINSEIIDKKLNYLGESKEENKLNEYKKSLFDYIKNKTLENIEPEKFAEYIKKRLEEDIIEKVIEKASEECKKEVIKKNRNRKKIINKNTSEEDENKNQNKNYKKII